MKKSIFLFFAAILCAMSAGAAQVTPNGKYFYFKTSSTWNVDNPRYSVYFAWRNGGGEDKTWASCKTVPGTTDILYVTAPGEFWDIYFCRMNGSTTDNKDANVWNKTDKLQYDGSKNFWTKSTGWNGTASYSIYVPAISSVTLLDNGTNIISGTGTQADPYLVYVETAIKVKGVGTKVLDDPDAKLNYNFKQGTTSKQESTSATYQFTASATADTEYIINLDGYTKVNTTKSNVTKSATALYYKTVERAEETNTVTISYKCGDKDVQTGITEVVGVSTTSSFTAPTNVTGYKFTNWTIGAGIDLKAGTASDATITVVTKSASSDYTLVANYEEVLETVYFINTNKWARVNIHKWDGKAADSSWPGEKLTASGEKIGEYDVYSYTAKQGDYANVIFNSKTSGTDGGNAQTADLTWTAGKYYIYNYGGKSDWYTKEEAEALLVVPVVTHDIVVKAVVPEAWNSGTISIHYWGDGISAPSKPVATEKDGNWNKYTIKNVPEGTSVSVIFINGADWSNNANQTADITGITEDKCFQISAAKLDSEGKCTVKEVDCDATIEPEVDIYTMMGAGELGLSWDLAKTGNDMTKQADGTYTLVKEGLDLVTTGSYEYKVVKNHSWDWSIPTGNTNQTLKVDKAGTYTVTFTLSADKKKLTADAVRNTRTVAATAENGTVTGAGEYAHGTEVTLTATANDHYVFVNWTKGEEVVAKTAEYTFTVEEDVELKANFARDTHTLTATAENGTVTGAGEYTHGTEVTLTATPAFDYQFVKWSNESTDNPLTITVTDNETLEAIFAEVAPTEVKESGKFSISAHKTATFATGNLQYHTGNKTWRFAKQQYQVVGEQNIQLGHPDFTGWIDMLGYSADGKYGVNPSNANADYAEEFVDWGTLFPEEGWSTLSKEDWKYLLEERTNAANLQQVAKVGDILGIMLFPDNWTHPVDCNPTPEINHDPDDGEETKYDFTTQNYTLEQWTKLEQEGAVFLPAAGRRTGGWGNTTLSENVPGGVLDADGHYKHFDNCNEYAYYWTSTKVGENVNYLINCRLVDKPNDIYSVGAAHVDWAEKGRYGQSVRLAKVVYDKHTVTATAENGTVTGASTYTHGDTVTLTATANEHYVFVNWTKGEEVVAETAEYTFAVEADVELVANFKLDSHTVAATAENGTVTGAGEYTHGTEVSLTATPAEGYEFVNWTAGKDTVSTEATYTFTVEADVNLVANFQEVIPVITHTVTWYTAVGETTEVTLEEGATITKPDTNPEKEGYVFMGWTNECFVAEDGSDFTAIEDFGIADADKEYYAVFAVETTTGGGGDETGSVTMQYSGSTTTNMSTGNNAEIVGLDANEWSVVPTKGNADNMPGLNKAGDIRLYGNAKGGNYLTISSKSYTITDVTITYTSSSYNNGKFYVNDNETAASNINANEFVIKNANSGTTQVRIKSLVINYTSTSGEPTTTYSSYMTTCTPDEYTIEWSVNGEVTETTTVVEGDALVLPEAPAAPDACSEKVFMGWATTATVNADGSAITWVDETFVPESDKTYYAVFATEIKEETNETYTKTATVSIADYATANSWADATKYKNVIIDQNITATAISTGSNTGKYYANGNNWRLYQTEEDATLTIGAAEGVTINSVIVTYTNTNGGVLTFNTSKITSGTTVEVNAPSITFGVGNTGTATNGQVRVTKIAVDYTFSGTLTSTTYTDYSTICVIPEYTVTFDYSVDAGYITVNDDRISEKEVKYAEGTVLTVKALTFDNYRFDAWEDEDGNELSTEPTYTFTVAKDVVLKAIITNEQGAVGTGVENNNVVTSETMKVIQNGRLFIIREGKIYNAQGQAVK